MPSIPAVPGRSAASTVSGERLTADDHLFVIMEQVMNMPVIPQVIWRVTPSGPVGDALDTVEAFGSRLATGRLSRLVRRSRGPFRDRWEFTPNAGRIRIDRAPVARTGVHRWVAEQLEMPLDSVCGPSWQLTAVSTFDGDVFISLVRSHVVADGAAMIRAVSEAVVGAPEVIPVPARWFDGIQDSATLLTDAGRAAMKVLSSALSRKHPAPLHPPQLPARSVTGPAVVPTVAIRVDATRFEKVAASMGGTINTLFQAVTLGVLVRSGRVEEGDTVPLAVPMSMREAGFFTADFSMSRSGCARDVSDLRANATTGATVRLTVDKDRYRDLSQLRTAAKEAYREVKQRTGHDRIASMAQLAQALPDAVVRHATSGSTTPICLASNLGEAPTAFTGLGLDHSGCDVALRSVIQTTTAADLVRRRGGVSAWAVRIGSSLSISFTSLDPLHVLDRDHLITLVADELGAWGLEWGREVSHWL